ncbi:MAG: hypothetical protein ABR964_00525 [Tepidisphaeraceae bacterium]|jgi:hypothetical protein
MSATPSAIDVALDSSVPNQLGISVRQNGTAIAQATAAIPVTTPTPVGVEISSNGGVLANCEVVVQPSPYGSDGWLAMFGRDADGYTNFPVPANAVIVGNQSGDVGDFRTAQQLAASNSSPCVLFRRGQTYTAAQINNNIQTNGTSPARPFIVGCTGDASLPRPILAAGFGLCGKSGQPVQNVVVFGLDFYDSTADPSAQRSPEQSATEAAIRMIDWLPGGQNVSVEDCRVRFMQGGLEFQETGAAPFQTLIVRRCTVDHCYGQRWGIYTNYIRDLLIDQCVLDHNGWMENIHPKDIFSHNVYLQTWPASDTSDPQTRVRNCILARAASHGCQQRCGGLNDGCCYVGNPIAGFVAKKSGSAIQNATVCGAGFDLSIAGQLRGMGLQTIACPSAALTNCILFDKQDAANNGWALQVAAHDSDTGLNVPTVLTASGLIVHNWTGPSFTIADTPGALAFSNCDLPGYMAPGVVATPTYADPARTVVSYAKTLGLPDAAGFLAAAALNRRGSYDARLTAAAFNAYIRAGYAAPSA